MKREFNYIFLSLFHSPNDYIKIIEALSIKKYGLTRQEIIAETKIMDNGDYTKKLEGLKNCGFIREYSPMNFKKKSIIYQLIDPFTIFHFHFLRIKPYLEMFLLQSLLLPKMIHWL